KLESATERVALHERDRVCVAVERGMQLMHAFDAKSRVGEQMLAIALADQAAEKLEVAAEVVNVCIRSHDDVREAAVPIRRSHGEIIGSTLEKLAHLFHQRNRETGAVSHVARKTMRVHE